MAFFIHNGKFQFLGAAGFSGLEAFRPKFVRSKWGMLLMGSPNSFIDAEQALEHGNVGAPHPDYSPEFVIFNGEKKIMSFCRQGSVVHIPLSALLSMQYLVVCGNHSTVELLDSMLPPPNQPLESGFYFKYPSMDQVYNVLAASPAAAAFTEDFMMNRLGFALEDLFSRQEAQPDGFVGSYDPYIKKPEPPVPSGDDDDVGSRFRTYKENMDGTLNNIRGNMHRDGYRSALNPRTFVPNQHGVQPIPRGLSPIGGGPIASGSLPMNEFRSRPGFGRDY